MKPHIADFLKFLESKENKRAPLIAKLQYPDEFTFTEEDLNVKGDLVLIKSTIKSLPDNLTVKGYLLLRDSEIESLPDNLTVRGSLYVQGRSKIKSLPNNLKVGETLYLWDTPLASKMTKEEIRQEIEKKGGYVKRM